MAAALALWLLPVALLFFLLLLLGVVLCKRRQRAHDGDDSDSSSDEDDGADSVRQTADVQGDAREETLSLIVAQRRRRRRRRQAAERNRHGGDDKGNNAEEANGGALVSLRALLSWGSSGTSTEAHNRLPPLTFRRTAPAALAKAPKRFHRPHFFPLLEETARWWAAQSEGDQAAATSEMSETSAGATKESAPESVLQLQVA